MSSTKYIYDFSEGSADMRLLLGGKGANLAQMWKIGLPVPPGFIITTEACHQYWKENDFIAGIWSDVEAAIGRVEKLTGKNFGSSENPLLVSVRSGAPVSMPGMMDTILNLGLNDDTVKALAKSLGVDLDKFEKRLEQARDAAGVKEDYKIPAEELKKLVEDYKQIVADAGHTFPTDPWKQLRLAIDAVFRSWNTPRAITYRKINNIPEDYGTAVNVIRQPRRRLRHRRLLHEKPLDRRKQALRRIPHQRAGRRRRRGYPHAYAHRLARRDHAGSLQAVLRYSEAP